MPSGRLSSFKKEFRPIIIAMAKLGATDRQIAEAIGVTEQTFNNWKKKDQAFFESLKEAKNEADEKVEASLYKLAVGYTNKVVKPMVVAQGDGVSAIEYAEYEESITPNTTAIIFWLKNRQPAKWRDKQEHEHSGEIGVTIIDDIK